MKKNLYIFIPAFLGLAFLVWLSASSRMSYDDLFFAACFKAQSFSDAFYHLYSTHAFRWTTFLFEDLVLGIPPGKYFPLSIPLFFSLLYGAWAYGLHLLMQKLVRKYFNLTIPVLESIALAALTICVLYFSASQAVESFTSVIVVTDRLLPMLFLTLTVNLFLSAQSGWRIYAALFVLALLIAGTAENVTMTVLTALGMHQLYQKIILKQGFSARPLVFGILLATFFVFEAFSKGAAARYTVEKAFHFTCGTDGVYCANDLAEFLRRFFISRQLFVFVLASLFFVFAGQLPRAIGKATIPVLNKAIVFTLILIVPVAALHFISALSVFECYGPMRMWLPLNFVMALAVLLMAVKLGLVIGNNSKPLKLITGLLASVVFIFYFVRHYPETSAYTKAYDERVTYLLEKKTTDSVVVVEPLPPAGIVVQSDITQDEKDDVNRDFKNTYFLPFDVRRK